MAKCKQCNKDYKATGRSLYCSPACKQTFYRNRVSIVTSRNVTIAESEPVTIAGSKRGKDIKCFNDLPMDVQQTIFKLCPDVVKDHAERCRRSAIAITYQQTFGAGAYYPHGAVCTGVVTGKPGDADYNGICTEEWRQARGR